MTLNGDAKKHQPQSSGLYYKANGLVNGKNCWILLSGKIAIWYNIGYNYNQWVIGRSEDVVGRSEDLGLNFSGIISDEDVPCPTTSGNMFEYYDGIRLTLAPIDSVSIQCV